MSDAPERIWATEDAANFGEDRFHTTRPMAGLTEYIRADVSAARIADLTRQLAEAREVKPLEWEESVNGRWIGTPPVKLGGLAFWIFQLHDGYVRFASGGGRVAYPALEAAQAAAQADYQTRILSALKDTP